MANLKNVAYQQKEKHLGNLKFLIYSQKQHQITVANALLEATWETGINAVGSDRMYILRPSETFNFTPQIEETQMQTGDTGYSTKVIDGKQEFVISFVELNDKSAAALKSFDSLSGYCAFVTENDYVVAGGCDLNLEFVPVRLSVTDKFKTEAGAATTWQQKMTIHLVNRQGNFSKSVGTYLSCEAGGWRISDLRGIEDVVLTSTSATTTEIVLNAVSTINETEISSLVTADFYVKTEAGVAVPVTVANVGNIYTLTGTFVTSTNVLVGLLNQPAMTTKGYEMAAEITVAIP